MTTHILSMTYQPKIEGVRNGTIRQTIRPLSKVPRKVGDKLILHGWSGKPYRSPWSWRREEIIRSIAELQVDGEDWVYWDESDSASQDHFVSAFNPWEYHHDLIDEIARLDGITPPTGIELKHVLESYHGKFTDKPVRFQVVRW